MPSEKRQVRPKHADVDILLDKVMSPAEFLRALREPDRKVITRQLDLYKEKAGQPGVKLWQRLASVLLTFAPQHPKLLPPLGLQFFVPDGRYRKQVFALAVEQDNSITLFTPNVLPDAVRQGVLLKARQVDGRIVYPIPGVNETLTIFTYDATTPEPAVIYKAMTGWNRKAIGISLQPSASPRQVAAAEQISAIASLEWAETTSQA